MKSASTTTVHGGNVQHSLEHGVSKATAAAHSTIDSLSDAAKPALDHVTSSAHDVVDRAGLAAAHAAESVGAKGDQLSDSTQRMVDQASVYVREHPIASLGMAVAAGYILSRLLSSR